MKAPSHFHQLRNTCLPLILSYFGDLLKHDRRAIRKHPDCPFIHVTRDYGTYLTMLPPADSDAYPAKGLQFPYLFGTADRMHILTGKNSEMEYAAKHHPNALVHYFNGEKLIQISHQTAKQIIHDYISDVKKSWYPTTKQAA